VVEHLADVEVHLDVDARIASRDDLDDPCPRFDIADAKLAVSKQVPLAGAARPTRGFARVRVRASTTPAASKVVRVRGAAGPITAPPRWPRAVAYDAKPGNRAVSVRSSALLVSSRFASVAP